MKICLLMAPSVCNHVQTFVDGFSITKWTTKPSYQYYYLMLDQDKTTAKKHWHPSSFYLKHHNETQALTDARILGGQAKARMSLRFSWEAFFWNTGWARAVVAFVFSISKVFFSPLPHTRLFMVSLQSGCVFSTPQFFASDVVTICQHSRENNVIKEETVQQSCCWSISWIAPYNENSILSSCKILHNTNILMQ